MRHLGPPLPMAECGAAVTRQRDTEADYGSCFWAIEHRASGGFIGYCGIKPGPASTPIAEQPEIGWGIAPDHWRQGLAREAALACIAWAWQARDWPSLYAITAAINGPSWSMMRRIGMMQMVNEDFDHPALATGDPLRRHVLYRIDRP